MCERDVYVHCSVYGEGVCECVPVHVHVYTCTCTGTYMYMQCGLQCYSVYVCVSQMVCQRLIMRNLAITDCPSLCTLNHCWSELCTALCYSYTCMNAHTLTHSHSLKHTHTVQLRTATTWVVMPTILRTSSTPETG